MFKKKVHWWQPPLGSHFELAQGEGTDPASKDTNGGDESSQPTATGSDSSSQPTTKSDSSSQPTTKSDSSSQPTTKSDSSSQPTTKSDSSSQPTTKSDSSSQPTTNSDNSQPTTKSDDSSSTTQTQTATESKTETTSVTKTPTKDTSKKKKESDEDVGFFARMFRWLFGDDEDDTETMDVGNEYQNTGEESSFWQGRIAHSLYVLVAGALLYGCLRWAAYAPPNLVIPLRVGAVVVFLLLCILQNVFLLPGE